MSEAFTRPNGYMLHRIGPVLVVVGVQLTNVRPDPVDEAAANVQAGKVAFIAAEHLRQTGAAIAERMNDAALAAAAERGGAGVYAEEYVDGVEEDEAERILRPVEAELYSPAFKRAGKRNGGKG